MSVRYLPKAGPGAVTTDTTDTTDPTGGFSFDPNDPNNTTNQLHLLQILATLQNNEVQNANTAKQGTPVMPPIEQILAAQQSRAKDMASSYAPGTQYLNGAEPGGLADVMGQFMHQNFGVSVPKLSDENRRVNEVPMDSLGSSFEDALGLANKVADNVRLVGGVPAATGSYGDMISSVLGKLTTAKANEQTTGPQEFTGMEKPAVSTAALDALNNSPAFDILNAAHEQAQKTADAKSKIDSTLGGGAGSKIKDLVGIVPGLLNRGVQAITPNFGPISGGPGGGGPPGQGAGPGVKDIVTALTEHRGKQVQKRASGGVEVGSHYAGPTLLQVGERSPKDKNYETSEVVLAAPGTVVAPIPKGMKNPSPEDAAGLLMAQIFKTFGGGQVEEGQPADVNKSANGTTVRDYYSSGGNSGPGRMTSPNDFNSYLQSLIGGNNSMSNYKTNEDQIGLNRQLGLGQLGLGYTNAANQRYATDVNAGVSERNSIRNTTSQNSDRALQQLLGMRGLDLQSQKNQQDYTLGQGNLAARNSEASMTNATNQRQLDLTSAQQAFDRIMAGLSGAALPLLSRRAPTTGSM